MIRRGDSKALDVEVDRQIGSGSIGFVLCGLIFLLVAASPPFRTKRLPVDRAEWSVRAADGSQAWQEAGEEENSVRFVIGRSAPEDGGSVRATRRGFELHGGRPYRLRLRARSSPSRELGVQLVQDHAPWESLGLSESIEVSEGWSEHGFGFVADEREPVVSLQLSLGREAGSIEVADIALSEQSWGVEAGSAVTSSVMTSPDGRDVEVVSTGPPGSAVRLIGPWVSLEEGARYRVQFRGQSGQSGTVGFRVLDRNRDEVFALETPLSMTQDWQEYYLEFVANFGVASGTVLLEFRAGLEMIRLEGFTIGRL